MGLLPAILLAAQPGFPNITLEHFGSGTVSTATSSTNVSSASQLAQFGIGFQGSLEQGGLSCIMSDSLGLKGSETSKYSAKSASLNYLLKAAKPAADAQDYVAYFEITGSLDATQHFARLIPGFSAATRREAQVGKGGAVKTLSSKYPPFVEGSESQPFGPLGYTVYLSDESGSGSAWTSDGTTKRRLFEVTLRSRITQSLKGPGGSLPRLTDASSTASTRGTLLLKGVRLAGYSMTATQDPLASGMLVGVEGPGDYAQVFAMDAQPGQATIEFPMAGLAPGSYTFTFIRGSALPKMIVANFLGSSNITGLDARLKHGDFDQDGMIEAYEAAAVQSRIGMSGSLGEAWNTSLAEFGDLNITPYDLDIDGDGTLTAQDLAYVIPFVGHSGY